MFDREPVTARAKPGRRNECDQQPTRQEEAGRRRSHGPNGVSHRGRRPRRGIKELRVAETCGDSNQTEGEQRDDANSTVALEPGVVVG